LNKKQNTPYGFGELGGLCGSISGAFTMRNALCVLRLTICFGGIFFFAGFFWMSAFGIATDAPCIVFGVLANTDPGAMKTRTKNTKNNEMNFINKL